MKTKFGTQVHLTISPTLTERIIDVRNVRDWGVKPKGGLWTSSYVNETCGWVEWCDSESFLDTRKRHWFILEPKEDVKIYTINSLIDLRTLLQKFWVQPLPNFPRRFPDFERMGL